MITPPAGISEAEWLGRQTRSKALILSQQKVIEQLLAQLTAMATELARLRERIGRTSCNSSKPPSSDSAGF
jgi:hypothetical protein